MKQLIFFLFFPTFAFSQTKGDNTITIKNITSEQAVSVFLNHGYMIGAVTPRVVSTVPKKSENKIEIIFQIEFKDSTGFLKCTYDGKQIYNGLWQHSESYAGHYKGGSFQIMDSLAKAFGKPVSYSKQ